MKKFSLSGLLSLCAVALLVASFVLPPSGVIDNSVIAAVGEIFAFAALSAFKQEVSTTKTIKHGSTEVIFSSKGPSNTTGTPNPDDYVVSTSAPDGGGSGDS